MKLNVAPCRVVGTIPEAVLGSSLRTKRFVPAAADKTVAAAEDGFMLFAITGILGEPEHPGRNEGRRRLQAHRPRFGAGPLTERADDKVSTSSMGLHQRLGLAASTVGRPSIAHPRRANERPRSRGQDHTRPLAARRHRQVDPACLVHAVRALHRAFRGRPQLLDDRRGASPNPPIRTSLHMSTSSQQWIVSACMLGYGGFLSLDKI